MIILLAFISGFLLDVAWAKTVAAVSRQQPFTAANMSVLLYLLTVVSTVLIVEQQFLACAAYMAGNWTGTFSTVKWWVK
jgi:hypothetical protein